MKNKKPIHRVDSGKDTLTSKTITDRASKVTQVGTTANLYVNNPAVKSALDALIAEGPTVVAAETQVTKDEATVTKSRGVRDDLVTSITGTYSIAVATVEKYATSPADLTACGFDPLERAHYAVVVPLELLVSYDTVKSLVDIVIKHAPGMSAAEVEFSPDPITATSWKPVQGIALEQHLAGFAPGTYWFHARHVRGKEVSPWLGPVSVIVK